MGKKEIILPRETAEYVSRMTDEQAGRLFKSIYMYHEGEDVVVDDKIQSAWDLFECLFKIQANQREENRQNGRKGGRPKTSKTSKTPKTPLLGNESESEEEKVILKEEGKDKAKIFKENLFKRKDEEEQYEVQSEVQQLTLLTETQWEESTTKGKGRKAFVPPTVEEVAGYCAERGYRDVDAEKFCAYYGSIGWKVGNHSMKNWRLAVVTWHKKQTEKESQRQQQRPTGNSMAERAYRMVHFELENNPEGWIEEERKYNEYKKQHGL